MIIPDKLTNVNLQLTRVNELTLATTKRGKRLTCVDEQQGYRHTPTPSIPDSFPTSCATVAARNGGTAA
jgi:hypothetical protein